MPISPQITITPEDITTKSFDITAVTFTSSTATYTATGHTFSVGDIVLITEIAPDGYNGTLTITAIATNTFTVANTTNAAVTKATGNAFWASATDYELAGYSASYLTTPDDVNSLIDVNSTVAAATAAAASAATAAGTAQSTANTALANAATAYSAAVASLQPSANTIVNASNQMTAIAANGITVYSGSSSSSGARVVLNSTGLAGFDSGGSATFSISASTGAAVFSGSVTGSTITGGTLNIAGNAIIDASGLLTATGATITGAINATSGYFGTSTNGFSISSTGLVGVGAGTIVGGTISGTTFTNGSTFSVSSTGVLTASSGTIAGFTLNASTITNGSTMTLYNNGDFYTGGVVSAAGGLYSTSACSFGSTLDVSGTTTLTGSVTLGSANTFQYLSSSGTLRSVYTYGKAVTGRAMQINSAGDFGTTASTLRKKHKVEPFAIDTFKLLQLKPKTFKYLPEIDELQEQQYGFIAEEAEALGLLPLVLYNSQGQVDYFAYEKLPIFLLQLAQEQEARIQALEGK
jgi:hypothetical protein